MMDTLKLELHAAEERLLDELRGFRKSLRAKAGGDAPSHELTIGQKIADQVAATMGSWNFIIVQSPAAGGLDRAQRHRLRRRSGIPIPFILLNLALSFQAAYAAPFIMMAQNRQQDIDRKEAENDYKVNIKAELEIELLHQKIDELREKEVLYLTQAIAELTEHLKSEKAAK